MVEQEKSTSKKLMDRAIEEGKVPPPFLKLATQIKDEAGNKKGVKGTGKHTVKFISDKAIEGETYQTKEKRPEVQYIFEEDGQNKKYNVPVHNKNGELHYFVQRMADIQRGEIITLEYQKIPNSFKGYIEVKRIGDNVQEAEQEVRNEELHGSEPVIPIINEEEEIDVSNIPF